MARHVVTVEKSTSPTWPPIISGLWAREDLLQMLRSKSLEDTPGPQKAQQTHQYQQCQKYQQCQAKCKHVEL